MYLIIMKISTLNRRGIISLTLSFADMTFLLQKINKNGIIGYVANQKGQNWVEYSFGGEFEIVSEYQCVSKDCKIAHFII